MWQNNVVTKQLSDKIIKWQNNCDKIIKWQNNQVTKNYVSK